MVEKKEILDSWDTKKTNENKDKIVSETGAKTNNSSSEKKWWINLGSIKKPETKKTPKQKPLPPSSRKVKKGTKLGMKWLFILWGLFFFFLIILLFLLVFIINNPDMGSGFGFSVNTNKQISMSIAFLIFVPFFMLFLILFLIYAYRLVTKKIWRIKNIAISILIFVLGTINIIAGTWTFIKISQMGWETKFATNDTLVSYVEDIETPDNKPIEKSIYEGYWYPLIAPLRLSFGFNTDIYEKFQKGNIEKGNIIEKKLIIYCGNGVKENWKEEKEEQVIEFSNIKYIIQNKIFSSSNSNKISNKDKCFYDKKWKYTLKLELVYKGEGGIKTENLGEYEFEIKANVEFLTKTKFTDDKSWLIIWNPGELIKMDFTNTINDLPWVDTFEMAVDFDGDKKIDTKPGTKSFTTHIYDYPKEYNIRYKFVWTDYPIYRFTWIVEPGDKPSCNIKYENNGNRFLFYVKSMSRSWEIEEFDYIIKTTDGVVEKEWNRKWSKFMDKPFSERLKEGKDYIVEVEVRDSVWEIGKCKTDPIILSNKKIYSFDMHLNTTVKWKTTSSVLSGDTIITKILPTTYDFEIKSLKKDGNLVEDTENINIWYDTTNNGIINVRSPRYEITIKSKQEKTITAIIKDNLWNVYKKKYTIKIDLQDIVADLKLDNAKWEVPFTVTFDASASEIIDKNDEILKFLWDFGDGTPIEESREWIREHTYKRKGRYEPKVTVVTASWKKNTTSTIVNAQIWIKTIKIRLDSHPTWTAWEGDRVIMNVDTGWVGIKKINWDFGDGNKFTCEKSECFDVVHIFEKAGNYKISAKVYLQDNSPPSSGRKVIKIKDL